MSFTQLGEQNCTMYCKWGLTSYCIMEALCTSLFLFPSMKLNIRFDVFTPSTYCWKDLRFNGRVKGYRVKSNMLKWLCALYEEYRMVSVWKGVKKRSAGCLGDPLWVAVIRLRNESMLDVFLYCKMHWCSQLVEQLTQQRLTWRSQIRFPVCHLIFWFMFSWKKNI